MLVLPCLCSLFGFDINWKSSYLGASLLLSFHSMYQLCMLCIAVSHFMYLVLHFGRNSMHRVSFRLVSGLFCPSFCYWFLHVCISYSMSLPCLIWVAFRCLRVGPQFACTRARISSCLVFIWWPPMWVWLRLSHVGVSPLLHCVCHFIRSIVYARLCITSCSVYAIP